MLDSNHGRLSVSVYSSVLKASVWLLSLQSIYHSLPGIWVLRLTGQNLIFSITSSENTSLKVKYSLINDVRIYMQTQNVHILVSNKKYSESQISKSVCHKPLAFICTLLKKLEKCKFIAKTFSLLDSAQMSISHACLSHAPMAVFP